MSGVIPPPTDPNDRPRPPRTHHYPRGRRRAPGRLLGKYGFGYRRPRPPRKPNAWKMPGGYGQGVAKGSDHLVARPDPLERASLVANPEWRALLQRIIKRDPSP